MKIYANADLAAEIAKDLEVEDPTLEQAKAALEDNTIKKADDEDTKGDDRTTGDSNDTDGSE